MTMTSSDDLLKSRIIAQLVSLAQNRLDPLQAAQAAALTERWAATLADDDLLTHEPETLAGAALALLGFARQRPPGQAVLRLYQPRADEQGWDSPHTVLEMVNDDMPFLLDSLTGALQGQDIVLHRIAHPVLSVHRDQAGQLTGLNGSGAESAPGSQPESWIQIDLDRQPAAALPALTARLLAVLDDVRAAVTDWPQMQDITRQAIASLPDCSCHHAAAAQRTPDPADREEVCVFLTWLLDNHFTFLGMRQLQFCAGRPCNDPAGGLGVLRDPAARLFDEARDLADMPAEVISFLLEPSHLLVCKAGRAATVHRPVPMDVIGIKQFDDSGQVCGLLLLAGLFTAAAYHRPALTIPLLRRKVQRVLDRSGFSAISHDGRALLAILDNHPRDELFQSSEEDLLRLAVGVLRLQSRQKLGLFLRPDPFGRTVSALVYIPRDRYDTRLRRLICGELEAACGGRTSSWTMQIGETPLARLHCQIQLHSPAAAAAAAAGPTGSGLAHLPDVTRLEARLAEMSRAWSDRLRDALVAEWGEERGLALSRCWGRAFPLSYCETTSPRLALFDLDQLSHLDPRSGLAVHLTRPAEASAADLRFRLYRRAAPVALSDVLPLFENLGFRALTEQPWAVQPQDGPPVWIHEVALTSEDGTAFDLSHHRADLEALFLDVWAGRADNDGLNRLVLKAGLNGRQIAILRTYVRYLRQTGSSASADSIERSLTTNPAVARLLIRLFTALFDPARPDDPDEVRHRLQQALDQVVKADEDRLLRRLLNAVDATLRTNVWQPDRPCIAIKLNSRAIDGLPLPRPLVEIFVHSPQVEGIHLRGGTVARGGLRWSDRPDDFRTEILGLMKAQMVKNAVIVPVGSKGGFVVRRPPPPSAGREAQLQAGIACYRDFISSLLDLTDTFSAGGTVTPPPQLVRRDGDDPYLVVAADKGTASFSDIANDIAVSRGFWLGDAFASGGSRGYDHKAMGITARGAWESIKRHFREMGVDCQTQPVSVVGVGDMSGDVFGNGMLRSPVLQLRAAFDHRHIFLDPDPDPAASFAERHRLFALPRSSWAEYRAELISAGGGVWPRDAKQIPLSAPVRAWLGLDADSLPPAELIRALLAAPVDLLWFGGIGTYVRADTETDAAVGDRANDAVRIAASALRCRVIGEGANLAMTQRARIAAALAGVRLNTDAIDNSAGVDTSDHEVNLKILIDAAVAEDLLTRRQRDELLASMTDDVAGLVLRDNILQTQALSLFEAQGARMLDQQERFMRLLEKQGRLDRAVEFLPAGEEIARRAHAGRGLTRPELAVLLSYGKLWLYDLLLDSDLPDQPHQADELLRYVPPALRQPPWRDRLEHHRLKRELIATAITNSIVNRIGGSLVAHLSERTGSPPVDVVRAYLVVRDAFALREVWAEIDSPDIPAPAQLLLLGEANRLIERGIGWILSHAPRPIDIERMRDDLVPGLAVLRQSLDQVLPADLTALLARRAAAFAEQGVPVQLARKVSGLIILASANDICGLARNLGQPAGEVARMYFRVGERFSFGWLRGQAERMAGTDHWQKLAIEALMDDLYARQTSLTAAVLGRAASLAAGADLLTCWLEERSGAVRRMDQLLGELKAAGALDLAPLSVASQQLRGLGDAG